MKLLQENEIKKFNENQEDELKAFLKQRQDTDLWLHPYMFEIDIRGLENNPIMFPVTKAELEKDEKIYLHPEVSDESVFEGMALGGQFAVLPHMEKRMLWPMRDIAFRSLLERVQVSGATMTRVEDCKFAAPLDPKDKADFLSKCTKLYSNKTSVLIQDEMVSTIRGSRYVPLDNLSIIEHTEEKLKKTWERNTFVSAQVDHSFFIAKYNLHDDKREWELSNLFFSAGIEAKKTTICYKLITSDVAASSVMLIPVINIDGMEIITNNRVCMAHITSIDSWDKNLERAPRLVELAMDSVKKLANIEIDDIFETLDDIQEHFRLSKTYMGFIREELKGYTVTTCTALDLYGWILEIPSMYMEEAGTPMNTLQKFRWIEACMRLVSDYAWENKNGRSNQKTKYGQKKVS